MLLVAGENLVDLIRTGQAADGAPLFTATACGSPYNCARALARLAVPVGYLTPVASDAMGDLLAAGLRDDGVRLLAGRSRRPAALALVTLDGGEARYRFCREGTADRDVTAEGLRAAMPEAAEALHLGSMALIDGPDAEAVAALVAHAAGRGLLISVDPNIRAEALPAAARGAYRARLARIFAAADIVKLSDADLDWLFPGAPLEAAAEALWAEAAPGLLVVTRGADGALARFGAGWLQVPAAPVTVLADTVGAGDSFIAAMLAGLRDAGALRPAALRALERPALASVLALAARAAAITCTRRGCKPPTRAELDAARG